MASDVVERVLRECGVPDLFERLERLAPADMRSLLLELFAREASRTSPPDVLADRKESARYAPSAPGARALHELDGLVFEVVPGDFEIVELAPVSPLGTSHAISRVHQNTVLSALRNAEVTADPTTAMALECALRREARARDLDATPVKLCASHRVMRLQAIPKVPGYAPHFRLFAMCTAGKDGGSERFEDDALREHVSFYLRLLAHLGERGYRFDDVVVSISDTRLTHAVAAAVGVSREELRRNMRSEGYDFFRAHAVDLPRWTDDPARDLEPFAERFAIERVVERFVRIRREVLTPLAGLLGGRARLGFDCARFSGSGYYDGYALQVMTTSPAPTRVRVPLIDGGFTDWTRKLLSNEKERMFVSAIGTELVRKLFGTGAG